MTRSYPRPHLTEMLEIVRFVLTCIDNDENELERVLRAETRGPNAGSPTPDGLQSGDRLRAELIAKRHVIGDLQQIVLLRDLPTEQVARDTALAALRTMTLPYRERPGYRPDWLPSWQLADA